MSRKEALARLDVFVGEWVVEARFPGRGPTASGGAGTGSGAWEKRPGGGEREHDFALTYRGAG